jgi:glutamyl-tRNA synthetase
VLRIEDTDVARSTQDSVRADPGLDALARAWTHDEGPIYQMQRLARYHEVAEQLIAAGLAYRCWCHARGAGCDARGAARARREDALRRPLAPATPGKVLPPVPQGVKPVVRFRNPADGEVSWNDLVKGPITIANREIDDLIILRHPPEEATAELPEAARDAGRADLQLRRGGGRLGHAHHARRSAATST